jgi:hypothetical protein
VLCNGAGHQFDLFEPRSSTSRAAWDRTLAFFKRAALVGALSLFATRIHAQDGPPPVGSVDVYGLRLVADSAARQAVGLAPGAALPDKAAKAAMIARLRALPNVQDATLSAVCCDTTNRMMLFIGIAERGAPVPTFRAEPTGSERLPTDILARDSVFQDRLMQAMMAGRSAEADSGGHEFFVDSALNAIQHEYLAFAAARTPFLRGVLRNSARSEDRALAAELLDYAPDVRSVIPDFVAAIHDPSGDVRNAAMRALWVIAAYAQKNPSLGIRIPADPFVDMLWSLVWTDRNKASAALWTLTETRDPELLAALRTRALRPLIDVAHWSDFGHAVPGLIVLGRIEGLDDKEIFAAMQRRDRTAILEQAQRLLASGRD